MPTWSEADDETLAFMAAAGLSGSKIADRLGRTRSAVLGRAHRLQIKLHGGEGWARDGARKGKKHPKDLFPEPKLEAERNPRPRRGTNIIKLVIPNRKADDPSRAGLVTMRTVQVERGPHLSMIVNERRLIDDFIARHGARRFQRGESGEYHAVRRFLEERGYQVENCRNTHHVAAPGGKKRRTTWEGIISLADKIRAAEGLPTLRRQA